MTQLGGYLRNVRDALAHFNPADPASPDTFFRRNLPRLGLADSGGDSGSAALVSQVMTSVPLFLAAGDVVTNLTFHSGQTAANTPTNWWFALYDTQAVPALVAQTADQTTAAWAAFTAKTLALSAPYTVLKTGVYWAAAMVKATAAPSLLGSLVPKPILTGERNLAQSSGSALVATAPATIATPTVQSFAPLVVAS
ncbi:hypothetical protein [Amycolatopsis plumensis]|uniref:Uncharacterized protein n=1 Tax=Amycolatopsis plumensis TaxID=236508 RepID=A0ABV5U9D3_9PSEU